MWGEQEKLLPEVTPVPSCTQTVVTQAQNRGLAGQYGLEQEQQLHPNTRDAQPVPRTHQVSARLSVNSGNSPLSHALGGPHLPPALQSRVVEMLPYGFLHCAVGQGRLCPVQMQLCASCTHTWSMCSFLGLCGIKDTKRSGVKTRDRGHLQETDGISAFLSFL